MLEGSDPHLIGRPVDPLDERAVEAPSEFDKEARGPRNLIGALVSGGENLLNHLEPGPATARPTRRFGE
jgi:hypothetical protein